MGLNPKVFDGQSADGDSVEVKVNGPFTVVLAGDLGGGTAKAQFSPDGGTTWADIVSASWTSLGAERVEVDEGRVRLNLASSTGADLDAWIVSES